MDKETRKLFSRRKILMISENDILQLCKKGQDKIALVDVDLPKDVMMTGVRHCFERRTFMVSVVSKEFPVVSPACESPIVDGTNLRELKFFKK